MAETCRSCRYWRYDGYRKPNPPGECHHPTPNVPQAPLVLPRVARVTVTYGVAFADGTGCPTWAAKTE